MDYYKKPLYKFGLFWVLLVVTAVAAYLYWIKYEKPLVGIDDANIYFVYMRNLALGHGFVFHPGGEHVEGFTSLLWVLIGSFFYLFTSKPEFPLLCLNIVLVTATVWKICLFADRFFGNRKMISPYTILISGFIFLIPGYTEWTILTLMETGLWSFILVSLFIHILQEYITNKNQSINIHLFLVLLVITRPESYLWGCFALVTRAFLLFLANGKKPRPVVKPMFVSILVFASAIGLLTIFRLSYFGYPFPNTYYAKISADKWANYYAGKIYMQKFFHYFTIHLEVPILCMLITLIAFVLRKQKAMVLAVLSGIVVITYLIPLYTGGDHFGLFRFIQPSIPLLALFYVLSFLILLPLKKWYGYVSVCLALIGIFFSCRVNYRNLAHYKYGIAFEFKLAAWERHSADKLNEFFQYQHPYPSNGVHTTGGMGYQYKGETIDLMGLNNVKMAHASKIKTGFKNHGSFNIDVFYQLKPDMFFYTRLYNDSSDYDLYENTEAYATDTWDHDLYKNILKEPRFRSMYYPVFIFSKKDPRVLQTYTHMDFLENLDTSVYSYYLIPR